MALKALKALCLVVHFLINEIHGFSQGVSVSPDIILDNSNVYIKAKLSRKREDQKGNAIGLLDNPQIASGASRKTDSKLSKKANTILNNNSNENIRGNTKQNLLLLDSLCKADITKISGKMTDQKAIDDYSPEIAQTAPSVLHKTDSKLPKTVFSTGVIVGAALGGAVFGSVITVIVFLCFCPTRIYPHNRNSDSKPENDKNLQECLQPIDNENAYSEINDQTFIRLQPMGRPESVNASLKDETYNHLYESDKKDMNVSYDHVNMVSSSCAGENELGNLTSVGNNSIPGGQD